MKVSALFLIGVLAMGAQSPVRPLDLEAIGPRVGTPAPSFSASDQHERARTLESILGSDGAMLVFFRSADW